MTTETAKLTVESIQAMRAGVLPESVSAPRMGEVVDLLLREIAVRDEHIADLERDNESLQKHCDQYHAANEF